jgi:hypothetical protein
MLAVVPFGVACALAERYWPARNLVIFFLQIAALLPLLPLSLAVVFRSEAITQIREWRKRRNAAGLLNNYESTTTVG